MDSPGGGVEFFEARNGEPDCPEMVGYTGDKTQGGPSHTKGICVNYWGGISEEKELAPRARHYKK